ncbi:hypothetical protein [Actinomyces howellii]|uniref:Uncharacterized protein n=1 Tax=Actinomyces howellii TaxID=52771 RepID=A0A448HHJ1_9ACTO|nr:hypothetical protein [Actinomyces howellii]VEG28583.1 Uncharacterised protein [Actinomyces howellii]
MPDPAHLPRHPRGRAAHAARVVRALRLGALIAVAALVVLLVLTWPSSAPDLEGNNVNIVITGLWIGFVWAVARLQDDLRRVGTVIGILLTALPGLRVVRAVLGAWWESYRESSVDVPVLLVVAATTTGVIALITLDILLLHLRRSTGIGRTDPNDPARWRPLREPLPEEPGQAQGPGGTGGPRRWVTATATALPVVVFLLAATLPTAALRPVNQVIASPVPQAELPQRPTIPATEVSWTYRTDGLLAMAAGAAGPILVRDGEVEALNPDDGTTRWRYTRPGASFTDLRPRITENEEVLLVVSPDARHLALRIADYVKVLDMRTIVTVVLDAVTGEVVLERESTTLDTLQLTDSVLLDGYDAVSLDDGRTLWSLPRPEQDEDPEPQDPDDWTGPVAYSGPAGHSTLIVDVDYEDNGSSLTTNATLTLVPEGDPTATTEVPHVAVDPAADSVVVVDGWTGQYSAGAPVIQGYDGKDDVVPGWDMQAVNLDELASGADGSSRTIPLGQAPGIHGAASTAAGTLVTLAPVTAAGVEGRPATTGLWVGAVLDTITGAVSPGDQYPGLAAARLGTTRTVDNAEVTRWVTVELADGSPPVRLRIDPTTVVNAARFGGCSPQQISGWGYLDDCAAAMSAPGVIVIALDAGRYPENAHILYGLVGQSR